jgi:hypothetical protein
MICKRLERLAPLSSLALGLWTLLLFYNVTEAAFGAGLLFINLLMASLTAPQCANGRVQASKPLGPGTTEPVIDVSYEMGAQHLSKGAMEIISCKVG